MGEVLGIDLGTTNCCVAVVGDDGRPRIIEDEWGRTVPSYVAIKDDGSFEVGENARLEAFNNPASVIFGSKRLMGQTFDSARVQQMIDMVPFRIVAGPERYAEIQVRGQTWTPEKVATQLLTHMRERAVQALGHGIRQAVISVPAHFDNNQRLATRNAAEAAGLDVLGLINEPTAAALAYGWATKAKSRLAVYDLGGGTFDITMLEMGDGKYDVLCTGGDTFLGGNDFDNRIAMHVIRERFSTGDQLKPLEPLSMLRLRSAAEQCKKTLSEAVEAEIYLTDFEGVGELRIKLTRAQLEEMTRDLVTTTIGVCGNTLAAAGIKSYELDGVLLVGGQTRMPAIRKAVKQFFFRDPNAAMNPDESVAAGAALHAHHLVSKAAAVAQLSDVTPLTLGIESAHDTFSAIIPAHTKVPCSKTQTFMTYQDNQKEVKIVALQGEYQRASMNTNLGTFTMPVAPGPRESQRVDVTFSLDASGILQVAAKDSRTGEAMQIQIEGFITKGDYTTPGGDTDADIQPAALPDSAVAELPDSAVTEVPDFSDLSEQ